jgi:CheY-like chemotaxis protein
MPKKLLLADDSVTIQRVIELTFAGEDVEVLTAGDGEEAIARIPKEKPDIILADIGMPKRSGYEVSAFVKGNAELENIPVLLLAGAFEPVDEIKAKEAKCDGVLVKPFEPHHVIARVRELISGAKGSPTQAVRDIPRPAAVLAPPRPAEPLKPAEPPKREEPEPISAELMDLAEADLLPRREDLPQIEDMQATPPIMADDTLDDYFDKLDEAFAVVNTSAPLHPLTSEPDALPPISDGRILDRDLDSFDDLPTLDLPAREHAETADPFAGIDPFPTDESLRVPTLDDLLAGLPPAPEPDTIMHFQALPSAAVPASPIVVAPPSVDPLDLPATLIAPVPPSPPSPPVAPLEPASSRSIIADAFSALLAVEQGEPGVVVPRLGGNGSAPVVTDATVDDVTRRVIQKLTLGSSDQMQATVREIVSGVAERLVREEIDRIRRNVPRS